MKYQLIDSEVEFIQAKEDNFEQLKTLVAPHLLKEYKYVPKYKFEGESSEGYVIIEFDKELEISSYTIKYGEYVGVSKQGKIFAFETKEELLKQFKSL